ncbi:MAG: divalent-cation tolerance protein CutA [Acidobacteriota bacterium]
MKNASLDMGAYDTSHARSIPDVTPHHMACVNIVPAIESIYHLEGKVTRDSETLMIIKTTDDRYPELERRVKELHSYSTPEVIAMRIERGSEQYLQWLRDSTPNDETR